MDACSRSCTSLPLQNFRFVTNTGKLHSPSLVSSIWGLSNLGRNYGILLYAPFLGTPTFSYLYAFISAAHVSESNQDGVCRGPACWTLTFEASTLAAALACGMSVYLWRAWKGRV